MTRVCLTAILLTCAPMTALAGAGDIFKQLRGAGPDAWHEGALSYSETFAGLGNGADVAAAPAGGGTFDEPAITFKTTLAWDSEYVFRGAQYAKQNVNGGLELSSGGLYGGFWALVPTADDANAYQTEVDIYGGYGLAVNDMVFADVGATGYIYNKPQLLFAQKDAFEVYGGLNFTLPLDPSVYAYYDFDNDVTTVEASAAYTLPFGRTDLVIGGAGGFRTGSGTGDSYFQGDVELVHNFNRRTSLALSGHWAIDSKKTFLNGLTISDDNSTWFGLTLKVSN